jgi:large subunit ribosomal protein L31
VLKVKEGIHPNYETTTVVCSCGNRYETRSTAGGELHVELCNQCHPFFTGQQKFVDTGGRVQRFSDKFGAAASAVMEKEAADKESRRKAAEEAAAKLKQDREAKLAEKAERAAKHETKRGKKEAAEEAAAVEPAEAEAPAEEVAAAEPVEAEVTAEEAPAEEVTVVEETEVVAEEAPAEEPTEDAE